MISPVSEKSLVQIRESKPCQTCKLAKKISACAQCGMVFYCSIVCQKKDWPTHKTVCKMMAAEVETFNPPQIIVDAVYGYGDMNQKEFNRLSYTAMLECAALVEEQMAKQIDLEKGFHAIDRQLGNWRREIARVQKSPNWEQFGVDRREVPLDFLATTIDRNGKYKSSVIILEQRMEELLKEMGERTEMRLVKGSCEAEIKIYTPELLQQKYREVGELITKEKRDPPEGPLRQLRETLDAVYELVETRLAEEKGIKIGVISGEEKNAYIAKHEFLIVQLQYQIDPSSKVYLTTYVTDLFKKGSQRTLHPTHPGFNILHPPPFNLPKICQESARLWKEALTKKDPQFLIPFSFLHLHGTAKWRGSAWCNQVLMKAALRRLGLPLLPYAKDVDWGMKTLEYFFLEDYAKDYPGFFVKK